MIAINTNDSFFWSCLLPRSSFLCADTTHALGINNVVGGILIAARIRVLRLIDAKLTTETHLWLRLAGSNQSTQLRENYCPSGMRRIQDTCIYKSNKRRRARPQNAKSKSYGNRPRISSRARSIKAAAQDLWGVCRVLPDITHTLNADLDLDLSPTNAVVCG